VRDMPSLPLAPEVISLVRAQHTLDVLCITLAVLSVTTAYISNLNDIMAANCHDNFVRAASLGSLAALWLWLVFARLEEYHRWRNTCVVCAKMIFVTLQVKRNFLQDRLDIESRPDVWFSTYLKEPVIIFIGTALCSEPSHGP
jgi:hypothetical protein